MADLRHRERRVAQLRGQHRRPEVLAARPDRRGQLRRSGDRVALAVGRRHGQPHHARRQRVVGAARDHRRLARRRQPEPLSAGASPAPRRHAGDAAHGRGGALLQHRALAGGGGRRRDRRDPVGLQPEELRGGDDPDDRHLPAAGGGLLDRRRGRRAHLLGHRGRLPGLRRRRHGAALPRLRPRRQRHRRRDGRPAPGRARGTRLPERDALRHPLAAHRGARPGHPRLAGRRPAHHQGSGARMGAGLGRQDRGPRLGLPHRPEQRRRVRGRHLAERVVALLGQRQRLVDARRRQRAGARLSAHRHHHQRLLRRRPARRQPVLGDDRRRRRRDRGPDLALPGGAPRPVGLRLPGPIPTWWTSPWAGATSRPWCR